MRVMAKKTKLAAMPKFRLLNRKGLAPMLLAPMFKKLAIGTAFALALAPVGLQAAGKVGHVENFDFSFEGPFGTFDRNQLQRGLQVYTETCAACHGLKFVPIRTLSDEGGPQMPEDQVRIFAADNFDVFDPILDDFRPATPVDNFPAVEALGAPDLSLMAKARKGFSGPHGTGINRLFKGIGGPEYIASFLTGYTGVEKEEAGVILFENVTFPGGWTSMGPALFDGQVEFADGHPNTVRHMSQDLAAFLMWTAEPKLMERRQAGFIGVLMLTVLSVLLYLTNKRIWGPVKRKKNV